MNKSTYFAAKHEKHVTKHQVSLPAVDALIVKPLSAFDAL